MTEDISHLINELVETVAVSDGVADANLDLADYDPEKIALVLESLPPDHRLEVWRAQPQALRLSVLVEMRADPRELILENATDEELDNLLTGLDAESLIELSESLPGKLVDIAFRRMDAQQQEWFKSANQYDEDETGRWLNHQLLSLPQNAKVRDAIRLLRRDYPAYTDSIFLTNRTGKFIGAVEISDIFGKPDHLPLFELRADEFPVILADEDSVDAAYLVQKSGFCSLPVTTEQGDLLGRMDIGTAAKVVNESHEAQLMAGAGLSEDEDLFSPVLKSTQSRAVWLGINLLTAFAASWFIGLFENTLEQVVALAVLMPVVASMGGIAGSQTLTLIIRGLALGQITSRNLGALLFKELKVGGLNGIIWASVVGIVVSFWFDTPSIGIVIGIAILVNIAAAALSGVLIPVLLEKLRIDPALSGAVILTTITDIVGFVAFLGLGTLVLI